MSELKTIRQVQESELQGAAWKQAMEHVLTHCYSCSESLDEQLALPLYDAVDRRWENMGYYGTNRRILQPSAFVCGKCIAQAPRESLEGMFERMLAVIESAAPPHLQPIEPLPELTLEEKEEGERRAAEWRAIEERKEVERAEQIDFFKRGVVATEKIAEHLGAILERNGAERDHLEEEPAGEIVPPVNPILDLMDEGLAEQRNMNSILDRIAYSLEAITAKANGG